MSVFKKGDSNKWYYRFQLNGKEYYRACKGAVDKKTALEYEAIVKAELMRGNLGIVENKKKTSMKEAVELYLEYSRNNKRSTENDNAYTNSFLKYFKNIDIDDITPALIEDYKKYLSNNGKKSKSTINRYLQALSKLFNVAIDNDKMKFNPMQKVKKLKTDNHSIRFLTKEEEKLLINKLPKFYFSNIIKASKLKIIVKFALKTGARKQEILKLKWDNINFQQRVIELLVTKSGKKRKIPLAKSLYKILLKLKQYNESEYVFTNPSTNKPYEDIKKRFNYAVKCSGIKKIRFHDLRHTFATRLIEKGIDIVVVKELLGHADIKTTMMYGRLFQKFFISINRCKGVNYNER